MSSSPPSHARPSHTLTTPRLILRSGIPTDAKAVATIRSEPLNNPYGGIHEPDLSTSVQAERLLSQQESTAKGETAWVQIILKPEFTDNIVQDLMVEEGVMIGMTGFNSFPKSPSLNDPSKEVLVGDTGAMIDYRYARKRYALEAMEAIFEYGFDELGCGMMSLDTFAVNEPWRRLMGVMGLGDVEVFRKIGGGEGVAQKGPLGEEISYRFDKEKWESCQKALKESGKWLL
jgi:RimJ/RimL family protein N-acetyltransferase